MNADSWRYDPPTLDVAVVGFKTMSEDAFMEWRPHCGEARVTFGNAEAKVVLAELTATNPNDKPADVPVFQLWSEEPNGASDNLGNGACSDKHLLDEFYGSPQKDFVAFALPDDWSVLQPGETRTFTLPLLICKIAFRNPANHDDIDPHRFAWR